MDQRKFVIVILPAEAVDEPKEQNGFLVVLMHSVDGR